MPDALPTPFPSWKKSSRQAIRSPNWPGLAPLLTAYVGAGKNRMRSPSRGNKCRPHETNFRRQPELAVPLGPPGQALMEVEEYADAIFAIG